MVVYLKKKKLFEIAKSLIAFESDLKLKDCAYRFYRGTEWLRLYDDSYIYELCAMYGGKYLSLEKFYYNEKSDNRIIVERSVLNGFGKCTVVI